MTDTNTEATADDTATPAKAPKDAKNGVTRPADGTKTRRVWELAEEISQREGRPALRGEVMEASKREGLVNGTIATQYGRWCTYYGISRDQREAARNVAKGQNPPETADHLGVDEDGDED